MHVREIPKLVFERHANDREEVIPAKLAQERYPTTYSNNREGYYLTAPHKIGRAAKDVWLALIDRPDTSPLTTLGVYSSYEAAAIHPESSAIAELRAGTRVTGNWSHGKGAEHRSEVWIELIQPWINIEDSAAFEVLAKLGSEALNIIKTGAIEVSSFGEDELTIDIEE
jgi:hypothetical protein